MQQALSIRRAPALALAMQAALLALLVVESVVRLPVYGSVWIGHDYTLYMDATRRWLETGQFYHPYQVAGPYAITALEVLYPPVALWLFVPFTVLPAIAWWAPVAIVAWVVHQQRPGPWARVVILLLLTFPIDKATSWAVELVGNGNPGLWAVAFVALATRWPFFGSWVLLKPSLLPFGLIGIRRVAWWAGAAVLGALSLPFGAMWLDYAAVLGNASNGGLLYSLPNVTLCLVPLVGLVRLRNQVESTDPHHRVGPAVREQARDADAGERRRVGAGVRLVRRSAVEADAAGDGRA